MFACAFNSVGFQCYKVLTARNSEIMESPLPPKNPYKTLNVAQDASLATIRSAHRKLVLTCHPDKFQDEAVKKQKSEQFHEVQQAYEILSDETKRQRYDDRVKLAELRAEMMEKGGSRGVSEFTPRTVHTAVFEMRNGRMYEERVPSRFHEEDSRFQEHRPVPRNYDDDRYSPPTPRRTSGRVPDERRRARDAEDERYADKIYARQSAKAAEKSAKHGREKRMDKDKRKNREAKFTSTSAHIIEDDDSSDATERIYKVTPKHRHEDLRRRDRDDPPRRSSRRDESDRAEELDLKIHHAADYIKQSRQSAPIELETRRPAQTSRHFSPEFEPRPPPPSAPPITPIDRRSTARTRERESRKSSPPQLRRQMTEIVDEPTSRWPSIPGLSSDSRGSKHMSSMKKESPRAFTTSDARIPSIRRADTMPIGSPAQRRAETLPTKHKLKSSEIVNDSGYSSPGTPPPLTRRTTYKAFGDDEPATIYVEPEDMLRKREISPRSHRQSDRPVMATRPSSNARGPLPRSNTYGLQQEPVSSSRPSPSFSRSESAARIPSLPTRHSSRNEPLYGEIPDLPYKIVHQSPKYRTDDISYSRRIPEETSRDSYPGSQFGSRHRPGISRNESKAY